MDADAISLLDLGLRRTKSGQSSSVLIVGDADFAYTLALERSLREDDSVHHRVDISTSSYEAKAALVEKYPNAAANIAKLAERKVGVRFGVDARAIATHYGDDAKFDRIVFNLPQSPPERRARNQIQRHRALLRDFCSSAKAALSPCGQLWVTLLAGQGGTPLDPVRRAFGDTWQIQEQAATAGLLVTAVASANLDALAAAGYHGTGRGSCGTKLGPARKSKGMVVHVLMSEGVSRGWNGASSSVLEDNCELKTETDESTSYAKVSDNAVSNKVSTGSHGACPPVVTSIAPMCHSLDVAFWVDGPRELPTPDEVLVVATSALDHNAAHTLSEAPTLVDSYVSPVENRRAQTYRFVFSSSVLALCRQRAVRLKEQVAEALSARFEHEKNGSKTIPT